MQNPNIQIVLFALYLIFSHKMPTEEQKCLLSPDLYIKKDPFKLNIQKPINVDPNQTCWFFAMICPIIHFVRISMPKLLLELSNANKNISRRNSQL